MGLVRDRDGKRLHVKSKLMGESLVSRSFMEGFEVVPQQRLFPDVNVVKLGGQSICDLGKKALPAVVREIASLKDRHKMLLTTGGGTRSRHIYAIGLELGMPTGIISKFGSSVSEQNALLVSTLLSPWGGIKIGHDEIMKLPTYFSQGCIPVMHGMPPYDYYAIPSPQWRIPIHRTDAGTMIIADLIGARNCIFAKDEKGLYRNNPKKNPGAEFIPEITAGEALSMEFDDLILERPCLEILMNSEVIDRVQVVNGLVEGNITKALDGEHVGTIIHRG
jgi:molybdenum storage protein